MTIAADTILRNGRVLTLDAACPRAQTVAIASDRVVAVGGL
jgi:predicted amidohydrolase YtcJ